MDHGIHLVQFDKGLDAKTYETYKTMLALDDADTRRKLIEGTEQYKKSQPEWWFYDHNKTKMLTEETCVETFVMLPEEQHC